MAIFLLDVERDPVVLDAVKRWQPSIHREWIIGALACMVLVTTIGFATVNEAHTNAEIGQTHLSLTVARQRIDLVSADLITIRHDLDAANGQVGRDSAALARDTAQLQGVQKTLANAQANVSHQTSLIGDLQSCLGGVEQASNALAVSDQIAAIGALNAVSLSCEGAVASND